MTFAEFALNAVAALALLLFVGGLSGLVVMAVASFKSE